MPEDVDNGTGISSGGRCESKRREGEWQGEDGELYYQERETVRWTEKLKTMGSQALGDNSRGDCKVDKRVVVTDVSNVDLLSFLEMLTACLYLPCLPQTCLCFPRLVPASLLLSLPCHVFRMVFTGVSVVSRVPPSSLESLSCPRSSLSSEFFVLRVLQRSFARLPPVFLELSLCSPMTSSFRHSFAALCLCS